MVTFVSTDDVRRNLPRHCWPAWLADFSGARVAASWHYERAEGGYVVTVSHTSITVPRIFDSASRGLDELILDEPPAGDGVSIIAPRGMQDY